MSLKGNLVGQRDDAPAVDPEDGTTAPARITPKRAIHVNLRNNDGSEVTTFGVDVLSMPGMVPGISKTYDYIALTYTGSNLTGVVYKTGGSGGTTVATLVLAYSGANLTSVTRT